MCVAVSDVAVFTGLVPAHGLRALCLRPWRSFLLLIISDTVGLFCSWWGSSVNARPPVAALQSRCKWLTTACRATRHIRQQHRNDQGRGWIVDLFFHQG